MLGRVANAHTAQVIRKYTIEKDAIEILAYIIETGYDIKSILKVHQPKEIL